MFAPNNHYLIKTSLFFFKLGLIVNINFRPQKWLIIMKKLRILITLKCRPFIDIVPTQILMRVFYFNQNSYIETASSTISACIFFCFIIGITHVFHALTFSRS